MNASVSPTSGFGLLSKTVLLALGLILSGCISEPELPILIPHTYQPAEPPVSYPGGLEFINDEQWNEGAVRRVLHLFAYGGHASDAQIRKWADMAPTKAISEILVVDAFHPLLSPVERPEHTGSDGTLQGLSRYWSGNHSENPMRHVANSFRLEGDGSWQSPARIWYQATRTRGLNPVRQKIGLYLTNYHLAVNLNAPGMVNRQVVVYYDDIMNALASGASFDEVLTLAAASAAIAQQYNHRLATFEGGTFRGNDDFAREYFQLFFGILSSSDNPNDPEGQFEYHENVTIPNMARLLTGIQLGGDRWDSPEKAKVSYDRDTHYRGSLEILGHHIQGQTALEKLQNLGPLAIEHPQSLHNLPIMIIGWLADDDITHKPAVQNRLRQQWASMERKDLMAFLRAYAISTDFHSPSRVKYYSVFDRVMIIHNLLSNRNADVFPLEYNHNNGRWSPIYNVEWEMNQHGFTAFIPHKDVFGGQTGLDSYNSADFFRRSHDLITRHPWRYTRTETTHNDSFAWEKRWRHVLPRPQNPDYWQVNELAEWLWQRFIADDLNNFGPIERAYVYAFLVSGHDPIRMWVDNGNLTESDWDLVLREEDFAMNGRLYRPFSDLSAATIDARVNEKQLADRIGHTVNFIVSTPYMFYQEGS